jgi:hypothetical protein
LVDSGRVDKLVSAWCARDHARALVPADHGAIDATIAARTFVMERIVGDQGADLFHGCLVLGRLLAARGASPTLAAATVDGAIAVSEARGEWVASARAALAEGYGAARLERARAEAVTAWDYPRCAVRLGKDTAAFAAGAPDDDDEALAEWAARVALAAQKDKVRHAIVGGAERPRAALAEALAFAGIRVEADARVETSVLRRIWRRVASQSSG